MDYEKGYKTVEDSRSEMTKILQYKDINGANRLFGGRLMEWIDEIAGIAASRHCGGDVITAAVDQLLFKKGALLNDLVVLIAKVTYVGRTSMEVRVDTYTEEMAKPVISQKVFDAVDWNRILRGDSVKITSTSDELSTR